MYTNNIGSCSLNHTSKGKTPSAIVNLYTLREYQLMSQHISLEIIKLWMTFLSSSLVLPWQEGLHNHKQKREAIITTDKRFPRYIHINRNPTITYFYLQLHKSRPNAGRTKSQFIHLHHNTATKSSGLLKYGNKNPSIFISNISILRI